nr:retrotransposon Gag protein [Tanacetum cinerariifolium]
MPPKRDPPDLAEAILSLNETLQQILKNTTATSEKQDIVMSQLTHHFEQNNTLLLTLQKPKSSSIKDDNKEKPNHTTTTHGLQIRPPKITLPTFDGSNPLDWLFQAEQYFLFYNIAPHQRLPIIAFYLSGNALSWYKYLVNNHLVTTWDTFTRDLETRFGPSSYDNNEAALFKLRQTSTVTEYQTEFERLSNCVGGLFAHAFLNCFLSGLRQDIQQELSILRPQSITQAIGLAKLIEDKNSDPRFLPKYNITNRFTSSSTPSTSQTPPPTIPNTTTKPHC